MSAIDDLKTAFRKYETDGLPGSGAHKPSKDEINPAFEKLRSEINGISAGMTIVANIAARDAFFATPSNQNKLVYVNNNNGVDDDPLNGVYEYVSGSARFAEGYYAGLAAAVQPLVDDAETAATSATVSAASAAAATTTTIVNATPTNSGFDVFTANNRNDVTYSEAGASAVWAIFPIPNRTEGQSLIISYKFTGHVGANPAMRPRHTDATNGTTVTNLIADGERHSLPPYVVAAGKTCNAIWIGVTGVCSGEMFIDIIDGASTTAAQISAQRSSGFLGALYGLQNTVMGLLGGSPVTDQQLRTWAAAENFRSTSARVYDGDGVLSTMSVVWHDGATGLWVTTATAYGAVNAFTLTHTTTERTKTVTQSAIPRNDAGDPTGTPAMTIS